MREESRVESLESEDFKDDSPFTIHRKRRDRAQDKERRVAEDKQGDKESGENDGNDTGLGGTDG